VAHLYCLGPTGAPEAPPLRTLYELPAPAYPLPAVHPREDTVFLCYSSGTTGKRCQPRASEAPRAQALPVPVLGRCGMACSRPGRSKGVELTHFNIIANIVQTAQRDRLTMRSDNVFHCVLPMFVGAAWRWRTVSRAADPSAVAPLSV